MRTEIIGDTEICYELKGDGYPLVMIMGLTANMDWWGKELIDPLAERYRLLMFDNRGTGRSSAGRKRFTMKRFACDTVRLMHRLGIARANVFGVSMGGMIAQELALNHPDRVNRLVLGCTFCGGVRATRPGPEVIKTLVHRADTVEDQARLTLPLLFTKDWLEEHPDMADEYIKTVSIAPINPLNAFRQMAAIAGFSTYGRLPRIQSPTLVMCGTDDALVPPENSALLARRIPGATLREFDDSAHGFITQCPEEVVSAVVDFLSAS